MSSKKRKKIKIFSKLAFDYIENDITFVKVLIKKIQTISRYDNNHKMYYSLANIPENKKYIEDMENNEDNVFNLYGFMHPKDMEKKSGYFRGTANLTIYPEINKELVRKQGNPFVAIPFLPNIKRLEKTEDKINYINQYNVGKYSRSYSSFINVSSSSFVNISKMIEFLDQDGTPTNRDRVDSIYFKALHQKDYDQLQKTILWINIFNELANVEDENIPLSQLIEDEDFVKKINDNFYNFRIVVNDYTENIISIFQGRNTYPSNISNAKTIKVRDKFLTFTKKDLKNLIMKDGNIKDDELNYVSVTSTTAKLDVITEKWINIIRGKKPAITIKNYKKIVSYAELRCKSDIFSQVDNNSRIDDDFINNHVNSFSLYYKLSEFGPKKTSVLIRILDLLGEDYVRNEIKLSHFVSLLNIIESPYLFVTNVDVEWIEKFILASLENKEKTDQDKTLVLSLIQDIYNDFNNIKIKLTTVDMICEMYSKDIPLYAIFNTLEIPYEHAHSINGKIVTELRRNNL